MRKIIVGLVGIAILSCGRNLYADTANDGAAIDTGACKPQTAAEASSGLFTVRQRCGHILYEIPTIVLDRVMLITTEYTALGGGEDDAQTSGLFADTRLVRWVRRGDQVHLELVRFDVRTDEGRGLTRAMEPVLPGVLLRAFDVLSEGKDGAPVIDVTNIVLSDLSTGFSQEFRRRFRMVQVDSKRSYVQSVKVFPQNIEISFSQTWNPDPKDLTNEPQPAERMRILFHASMVLLPAQPMQGRYADTRIGYLSELFNDYGNGPAGAVRRGFIQRYRLEKKDPSAEVSEPVRPIVFYLDREVPDRWRPYIKQGVEDWQVVFEKAGFRNAISRRIPPIRWRSFAAKIGPGAGAHPPPSCPMPGSIMSPNLATMLILFRVSDPMTTSQ